MPAGPSILESYWSELDRLYDVLAHDNRSEATRGRAQGVAWCIAKMLNPYDPNIEAVRREAKRRFRERNSS